MEWVECPKCKHKLFKAETYHDGKSYIEVKCHSCKNIVAVDIYRGEKPLVWIEHGGKA